MAILVNGVAVAPPADARISLLDHLRERLLLTGTKLGCNQGACGACTVIVDGQRVLACLTLAAQVDGRSVTTIEGLATDSGDGAVKATAPGARWASFYPVSLARWQANEGNLETSSREFAALTAFG